MKESYKLRRNTLLENKQEPCMICIFSGAAPMRSADESYPFSVDRNFYYLTGIERENMILMLYKDFSGKITENLFIEPYDEVMAKWVGGRMRAAEATDISGVESIKDVSTFEDSLNTIIERSRGLGKFHIYLDLWRYNKDQADSPAQILAKHVQKFYPAVEIDELYGDMAALRAIKSEEEIAVHLLTLLRLEKYIYTRNSTYKAERIRTYKRQCMQPMWRS